MTIPERIREAARLACEPARTELRKIADELDLGQSYAVQVTQHQRAKARMP